MLVAGLQVNRLAVAVDSFGVVAEPFDSVGKLNKRAEAGDSQNLAMQNVADVMLFEEGLPDVRLKLLDAE